MLDISPGGWEGLDGLSQALLKELRPKAERTVERMAMHLVTALQATLSGPRHGRLYRVPGTSQAVHVASAPGEPPAVLFGRLRQSINRTPVRWEGWTATAAVGTNVIYARILEWGGMAGAGLRVRIEPRPWVAPTVLREEPALSRIAEQGLAA